MKGQARIIGMGSYVPEKVLTNRDLEKLVDTSDEWIVTRTGMKERRLASVKEYASTMGIEAVKRALDVTGMSVSDVDLILVATMTPDHPCPSTAVLIQEGLNAGQIPAFDLQAACTGYLYGLSTAKAYIESGMYQTVLLVATEKMSAIVDYQDRSTCVLFGDGASCAIVSSKGKGLAIDTIRLGADGALCDLLYVPAGGTKLSASHDTVNNRQHFIQMRGRELFRHAVRKMGAAAQECMEQAGCTSEDLGWLIPHQANARIIDAMTKQIGLPPEKVYSTIHKYGNTSASSIAIALDELSQKHPPSLGDQLLLVAFGGGLTWGAALLKQTEDN